MTATVQPFEFREMPDEVSRAVEALLGPYIPEGVELRPFEGSSPDRTRLRLLCAEAPQ